MCREATRRQSQPPSLNQSPEKLWKWYANQTAATAARTLHQKGDSCSARSESLRKGPTLLRAEFMEDDVSSAADRRAPTPKTGSFDVTYENRDELMGHECA